MRLAPHLTLVRVLPQQRTHDQNTDPHFVHPLDGPVEAMTCANPLPPLNGSLSEVRNFQGPNVPDTDGTGRAPWYVAPAALVIASNPLAKLHRTLPFEGHKPLARLHQRWRSKTAPESCSRARSVAIAGKASELPPNSVVHRRRWHARSRGAYCKFLHTYGSSLAPR